MVYFQGCSTVLEVTKIGVFGLIYVSLVQVIGQARWSIHRCSTALEVMKISVFGLIYVSLVQVIGQARCSIPNNGVLTALEVTKIGVFGLIYDVYYMFIHM